MEVCSDSAALDDFFATHVKRACRSAGFSASPLTGQYLVQLLAHYAIRGIDDAPLALKYKDALEAPPSERRVRLREIGDTSLYVAGFFSESLDRRLVGVDYYRGMGARAYGDLAGGADAGQAVFVDLARNFTRFANILTAIADHIGRKDRAADILKLYDRWTQSGSTWARRRLATLGIVVSENAEDLH